MSMAKTASSSSGVSATANATQDVEKALELFEAGIEKEHIGKMSDAVQFYRRAFKIHDAVDKVYRERVHAKYQKQQRAQQEHLEKQRKVLAGLKKLSVKNNESQQDLDQLQDASQLELTEEEEAALIDSHCPLLEYLPNDVFVHILKHLALGRAPDWVSFSLTCKRLAHLGFDTSSIWEALSVDVYRTVYPSLIRSELDHQAHTEFSGWKNMYFKKPFIKFGGIYISVCTYLREGSAADSISWSNPIHMITYYRYLRFFKSGTCLRLLTVSEPHEVVPKLTEDWKKNGLQDVYNGFWSLEEDGKLTIEGEGVIPNFQFTQELKVANAGRRKHNHLKWIRSFCINQDNVESEFLLRHEKPFAFSRVKSYALE